MNRQIVQLFGLTMLLFAVLIGFTSRWAVFEQDGLEDETANRRPLIEEQRIPRGLIRASDGTRARPQRAARARASSAPSRRTYPDGPAVLPRGGLLVHLARPRRARAVPQRRR